MLHVSVNCESCILAGVATSIIFVRTNICLSRQNTSFVATNILSRQTRGKIFVATKMILLAAPANDSCICAV